MILITFFHAHVVLLMRVSWNAQILMFFSWKVVIPRTCTWTSRDSGDFFLQTSWFWLFVHVQVVILMTFEQVVMLRIFSWKSCDSYDFCLSKSWFWGVCPEQVMILMTFLWKCRDSDDLFLEKSWFWWFVMQQSCDSNFFLSTELFWFFFKKLWFWCFF